jgi:hypothetical protein
MGGGELGAFGGSGAAQTSASCQTRPQPPGRAPGAKPTGQEAPGAKTSNGVHQQQGKDPQKAFGAHRPPCLLPSRWWGPAAPRTLVCGRAKPPPLATSHADVVDLARCTAVRNNMTGCFSRSHRPREELSAQRLPTANGLSSLLAPRSSVVLGRRRRVDRAAQPQEARRARARGPTSAPSFYK